MIIQTWKAIRPKTKKEWKHFLITAGKTILIVGIGAVAVWLGCALS